MKKAVRLLALLSALLLCCACLAEDAVPATLPECTKKAQAWAFLDVVDKADPQPLPVQKGRIRHMAQDSYKPFFCRDYWVNDTWDLETRQNSKGKKHPYYAGNMCTRAVYSEALSYLGIDMTPVAMSQLMDTRNLDNPYDMVTDLIPGLTRAEGNSRLQLWDMVDRYLHDSSYSPVMLVLMYPGSTQYHTMLLVGMNTKGRAIVIDTAYHPTNGKPNYVFTMKIAQNGAFVRSSDIPKYKDMTLRAAYQWHYEQPEESEAAAE